MRKNGTCLKKSPIKRASETEKVESSTVRKGEILGQEGDNQKTFTEFQELQGANTSNGGQMISKTNWWSLTGFLLVKILVELAQRIWIRMSWIAID